MSSNPIEDFKLDRKLSIKSLSEDSDLRKLSFEWINAIGPHKWAYNFDWLGRPAIQFPNDAWQLQEIVWDIKPDLIIETGIAHGGSLIYSASLMALLDFVDAKEHGSLLDPKAPQRKVIGIDIDIREHNRNALEKHPLSGYIDLIEGSSIEDSTVSKVIELARNYKKIMVCLDSNHTHDHVLSELKIYSKMVSKGSYCIVYDTIIEDLPRDSFPNRPWNVGNNPKTAVDEFLNTHKDFSIDKNIDNKLQISVAPGGFLKKI